MPLHELTLFEIHLPLPMATAIVLKWEYHKFLKKKLTTIRDAFRAAHFFDVHLSVLIFSHFLEKLASFLTRDLSPIESFFIGFIAIKSGKFK